MQRRETTPNIIFLEFNELCPPLLEKWMAAGLLPNFRKFYDASQVFTTMPDVESPEHLEPWIQWYSIHTGLAYDDHKVFNLTDGPSAGHADIWKLLQEAGYTVGNIASMNAAGLDQSGSFFMSDPWCASERAFPQTLQPIQDFVQQRVQNYSLPNEAVLTSTLRNVALLQRLVQSGLSARTISIILSQLISEKTGGNTSWKRVALLDHILFDIFKKYYCSSAPSFSTFFANSTAHLQHAYWRFMEPEAFDITPSDEDLATYGSAVFFGYQNMDRLLGRFFELEKRGATLVLMSALSQQPFTKRETSNGQLFYRPYDMDRLLGLLDIPVANAEPVMTHQYILRFDSEESKDSALPKLENFTFDGTSVFDTGTSDDKSLFVGCGLFEEIPDNAKVTLPASRGTNEKKETEFFDLFYKIDEIKSGCHHPDGVLWFKLGDHKVHPDKVSILDVLPTLLEIYGVKRSLSAMQGHSLMPYLHACL
ncbi:MAG: hypothetical protein HOM58_05595 [Rhodospirillaceae bacterium]|jgi:hypothetical protein|nr:hypothetical protein [Rhodospirillaceae bacterium]MBT5458939.1 hypothetical protein [Rhodospirillaceae bacterium]